MSVYAFAVANACASASLAREASAEIAAAFASSAPFARVISAVRALAEAISFSLMVTTLCVPSDESATATLSDICYQLQKIGVKYMIPITFGKMKTSYSQGIGQVINKPENGFNY